MQDHPAAFWAILGLSMVIAVTVVVVFWRRDWL
jgi:Mg2+ and Co2+ transporter CorA